MRIAAIYDKKGQISEHFGHTEMFRIYDIKDDKVEKITMLSTGDIRHVALVDLLHENNVDVVLCAHIGPCGREALAKYNIKFVPNLEGDCDVLVAKYLANSLNFSLEKNCEEEQSKIHRCGCHSHH
jgi:predicted Fe-Mo cluster-binding NifX family protein